MFRTNAYPPSSPPSKSGVPVGVIVVAVLVPVLAIGGIAGALGAIALTRRPASATISVAAPRTSAGSTSPAVTPAGASAPPASGAVAEETTGAVGTPAASLRAKPPWSKREVTAAYANRSSQYAPQLGDPLATFLLAEPMSAEVDRGFVICRFQSFNKHDTFAGDDLHARVTFGATPEVANDGPEDGNLAFVSAPLVTLKKGDRIGFDVYDRDVFSLTSISRSTSTFTASPVSVIDGGAAVECRVLASSALGSAIATHGASADAALARIEGAKLDETKPDWAYPTVHYLAAERSIEEVAARAGWDDARTRSRVARHDAETKRLAAEHERVFAALHARTPAPRIRVGAFDITLGEVTPAKVTVSVTNRADAPRAFGFDTGLYLATRTTGPSWATMLEGRGVPIAAGATETRTIAGMSALPDEPAVLGICGEGRCEVLVLR